MPAGAPRRFSSPEELQRLIDIYFAECDKKEKPYTITGLALALNFNSRQTLLNYEGRPEFMDTIKKAKMKCQNYAEESLYTNRQVAGIIFNLKNNYGWVDKHEVAHSGSLTLEQALDELEGEK